MLVCPQCQFENPHAHQFCQKCGTSLTQQICQNCGAWVSFTEKNCLECQHLTGKILRVVMAETTSLQPRPDNLSSEAEDIPCYGDFLDLGQRYRLLASPEDLSRGFEKIDAFGYHRFFQGQVIDCRPLEKTELTVLLKYQADLLGPSTTANEEEEMEPLWKQLKIPNIARPYLQLQDFMPTLPIVYDAWQTETWDVLLLPDRSTWQQLTDIIYQGQSPRLQTIYWLNEMVTLWKALESFGHNQSLLLSANLRVDEDQILGLCQLYPNIQEKPLELTDLARFWQEFLLLSPSGEMDGVMHLCDRLLLGEISTLADLRIQLQDLADAEQSSDRGILMGEEGADGDDTLADGPMDLAEELEQPNSGSPDPITTISEADDMSTAVLPMELLSLEEIGGTDRGRQRHHNEDYFGIYSQLQRQQNNQQRKLQGKGLYIVCDGMGGHAAGEIASALAVEALRDYFQTGTSDCWPTVDSIREGIWLANQKLYQVNQQNASMGSGRMGTTLVMMQVQNTKVAIAHVGDSRIYRVTRKWGLEQLTIDHEVGQKAIQSGMDPMIAYSRPDSYQLTQALGPHDNEYVQPDVRFLELQEDTLFLLCSDGLSDNDLIEDNWEELLLPFVSPNLSLDQGIKKIIDFANQHNGHDNITGILVRMKVRPDLTL